MDSIIVVWNRGDDALFEGNVPLLFTSARNRKIGSRKSFHLIFLEGMQLLSEGYRSRLKDSGYVLHDANAIYVRLFEKYAELKRFGNYHTNCFLRWLVIHELFGDSPFVHYDGDVLFNATPEELEESFKGSTFILQGCPAVAFVSDSNWLKTFIKELDLFYADPDAYSAVAWDLRPGYVSTFKEKNSGLWNGPGIVHDQDLLQFLAMSDRIVQDDATTMNSKSNFALFQNPMRIGRDISLPLPLAYERKDGLDYIGGKKVAVWHLQSGLTDYFGYGDYRRRLFLGGRVPDPDGMGRPPVYQSYRIFKRLSPAYNRLGVYSKFFTDRQDLKFILNDRRWWEAGVFV